MQPIATRVKTVDDSLKRQLHEGERDRDRCVSGQTLILKSARKQPIVMHFEKVDELDVLKLNLL